MTGVQPERTSSEPPDWDDHWEAYGAIATVNPANEYRHQLIETALGPLGDGAVVLDIGSGQGVMAIRVQHDHPRAAVWGVEASAAGVRSAESAAAVAGVGARFVQRDLSQPTEPIHGQPLATHAICSEVLEHVPDAADLLRNCRALMAPGCRVVITVPGGPRSAFDKHIGHIRHYTKPMLEQTLRAAGLQVERVDRAGFPFFNLYKVAVMARGKRLVRSMAGDAADLPAGTDTASRIFGTLFRANRPSTPFGWQLLAVATNPGAP